MVLHVDSNSKVEIPLGTQGEDNVTVIDFDVSEWESTYGNGELVVAAQRNGEKTPYFVVIKNNSWTVTDSDTAKAGYGKAQVSWVVDGKIKKSVIHSTFVRPSLKDADATPPPAYESWVEVLAKMEADVDSTSEYADIATAKAQEASTSAQSAASSDARASTSADDASESALKAEGYSVGKQNGTNVGSDSEYYHNNAKYYSDQAKSSKTAAQTAAQTATTKADEASQSATTASTAASDAASAKNDAESAATTATTKANEAAQSASEAESAATDVYVKTGGRNYLIGTDKPFERVFLSESGAYETNHVSGTYQYQTLSDLGFKVGDAVSLSFDWGEELINLIPYPYFEGSKTANGITWTDNGDGSVTANGTATASTRFYFKNTNDAFVLNAGSTYKLNIGTTLDTSAVAVELALYNGTTYTGTVYRVTGESTITLPTDVTFDRVTIYAAVISGQTVNNVTFAPKLVCTSARGTFRLEGYRTDGTNYTYAANLLTGAGLPNDVVTPTETAMSGHVSSTLTMTSTLLNIGDVHIRADGVKGKIKISNLKLEKGEVSTAWTAAPEDAGIASPGINMIRGTNTFTTIDTSDWSNGTFRPSNYSAANGTNTPIAVSDVLVTRISRGVEAECNTAYGGGWGNCVGIVQVNIPNVEKRKAYTISCYAKGNGILQLGIGSSSGIVKRMFLDHVTEWARYVFTFIVPPAITFSTAQNRTNVTVGVAGLSTIQICGMKLEEGITATEWSAAPEDVYDVINDILGDFATVEPTGVATKEYKPGDYVVANGKLYEVMINIAVGSTISTLTNVAKVTVGDEIKNKVLSIKNIAVHAGTGDIATYDLHRIGAAHVVASLVFDNPSAVTSDVTWTTSSGTLVLNGTCTSNTTASVILLKGDYY